MKADKIKDLAAKHWHAKKKGNATLADVFSGGNYEVYFKLHELAFRAGWAAANRRKSK